MILKIIKNYDDFNIFFVSDLNITKRATIYLYFCGPCSSTVLARTLMSHKLGTGKLV
jgi:hypothetical protein